MPEVNHAGDNLISIGTVAGTFEEIQCLWNVAHAVVVKSGRISIVSKAVNQSRLHRRSATDSDSLPGCNYRTYSVT